MYNDSERVALMNLILGEGYGIIILTVISAL